MQIKYIPQIKYIMMHIAIKFEISHVCYFIFYTMLQIYDT